MSSELHKYIETSIKEREELLKAEVINFPNESNSHEFKNENIDNYGFWKLYDKSYSEYQKKLILLKKIDKSVLLNLNKFMNSIKYNVGVRQQPKLNRDLALYAATCNADHKDLSIHF